jgi:hypothetical protein
MWQNLFISWFIGFVMGGMVMFELYVRVNYPKKKK